MNAQELPDSSDLFFRHLELNEVVVTGLAGDTKVKHTPAPISVIRPGDLMGRASTNIINALAAEPGLSSITTGGGDAPHGSVGKATGQKLLPGCRHDLFMMSRLITRHTHPPFRKKRTVYACVS